MSANTYHHRPLVPDDAFIIVLWVAQIADYNGLLPADLLGRTVLDKHWLAAPFERFRLEQTEKGAYRQSKACLLSQRLRHSVTVLKDIQLRIMCKQPPPQFIDDPLAVEQFSEG